jgi:hypothetical protein
MKLSAASTDVNSITIAKEGFGSLLAETWTGLPRSWPNWVNRPSPPTCRRQEVGAAEEVVTAPFRFGPVPHQHEGRHGGGQPLRNR